MADLVLKDLSKSFGEKKVLDSITLEVKDGEFYILLGPSGCGKSTILRLIAGLEEQDGGAIFIGGEEVSRLTPKERDIAMVFQSYALYPHMNVFENMAFSLKMRRNSREEIEKKVRDAARLLDIEELLSRKPRELSGGQRQRVAIGRAIVRNPKLFLFDEPLSNLDAKLRSTMRLEIAALHEKLKNTIVYVTHDQIEAMTLGDKIVLLDRGRIQQVGTPSEVYESPANIFVASFIGSPQMNLVKGTLRNSSGTLRFLSDSFSIDMKEDKTLSGYTDKEIVLGIRPESLVPGTGEVRGTVEFIEHLGAEKILYVKVGSEQLIARSSADMRFVTGDDISLSVKEGNVHVFHKNERVGP